MVLDIIENRALYATLSPRIETALDFLGKTDFTTMEPGRYDIDGEKVFALVQEYQTIPRSEGKWECHREYIDVQYMAEGKEEIGFGVSEKMKILTDYNPEDDIAFLQGTGDFATLTAGSFGIFWPVDAHQPKIAPGNKPGPVKKVVIKIKIN